MQSRRKSNGGTKCHSSRKTNQKAYSDTPPGTVGRNIPANNHVQTPLSHCEISSAALTVGLMSLSIKSSEASTYHFHFVPQFAADMLPSVAFQYCFLRVPHRRREANLQKGRQLLREGKVSEARDCFTRCVNITPVMAHNLIKVKTSSFRSLTCLWFDPKFT